MVLVMGKHLMGAREVESRLGVSRQRVYQLTIRPDWPEPYDELAMGKVWRIDDIEAWIREHRPDIAGDDQDR
jgi:prophage regulatory protein